LAKKIAYSGEIGSIRQVVIEHGSDMLLWGHSHTIDLAMYICDGARVDRVQGRLRISPQDVKKNVVNSDPVLDMAYLEFNNGISTIITAGSGFCLRIYGETGSVTVIGDGSKVELRKKKKNSPYELNCQDIEFNSSISGTQQAFINLMKYVQSGKKTGLSLSEVKRVHQTLFALALSELNNGEAINPNNVPYDFIITGRFGNLYA
jgi:predicted dehydrogenase